MHQLRPVARQVFLQWVREVYSEPAMNTLARWVGPPTNPDSIWGFLYLPETRTALRLAMMYQSSTFKRFKCQRCKFLLVTSLTVTIWAGLTLTLLIINGPNVDTFIQWTFESYEWNLCCVCLLIVVFLCDLYLFQLLVTRCVLKHAWMCSVVIIGSIWYIIISMTLTQMQNVCRWKTIRQPQLCNSTTFLFVRTMNYVFLVVKTGWWSEL